MYHARKYCLRRRLLHALICPNLQSSFTPKHKFILGYKICKSVYKGPRLESFAKLCLSSNFQEESQHNTIWQLSSQALCLITKTRHTTMNQKISQEANNDKPQSLYGLTDIRTTRLMIMWWWRQQVNGVPPGWPQWKAHVSWWLAPADLEDKAQTE